MQAHQNVQEKLVNGFALVANRYLRDVLTVSNSNASFTYRIITKRSKSYPVSSGSVGSGLQMTMKALVISSSAFHVFRAASLPLLLKLRLSQSVNE